MKTRILFVCLGNICRSPTAEAVTRKMAQQYQLDLYLDSAGTGDWHVGDPPYGPMQAVAADRGYDLSDLRARQVAPGDFNRFDLILAMDADNLANLQMLAPPTSRAKLMRFTDFQDDSGIDHVPDPYFTREFETALSLLETCADGLLKDLAKERRVT